MIRVRKLQREHAICAIGNGPKNEKNGADLRALLGRKLLRFRDAIAKSHDSKPAKKISGEKHLSLKESQAFNECRLSRVVLQQNQLTEEVGAFQWNLKVQFSVFTSGVVPASPKLKHGRFVGQFAKVGCSSEFGV